MADRSSEREREIPRATEGKIEDLRELVDGIEVAMMTTRRADGHLVSRPMQTQKRQEIADFWYVTDVDTNKLDELEHDPHVNLAFYRDGSREWVSVSGTARISQDRDLIRRLHEPDWRAWFGDEGGERDGGPDDPRLALVLVDAHSVSFLKLDKPRVVAMFEVAKGLVTGQRPDVGEVRTLRGDQLP